MRLYILVHAVFHDASDDDRKIIYKCLTDKHWEKIHEHRITTLWKGISDDLTYEQLSETAKNDFAECAGKKNVRVNIYFQIGTNDIGTN